MQGLPLDDQGLKVETVQSINCEDQGSLLYTVPTFHNPTGAVMSNDRRKELLSICQSKRLPIVEDDAYSELWFDERPPLPLKAFDKNGLVLYMGSTSKVLGFCN
ncbi:aminotransferase class I/II-fold pyridoxal phosphate-dependent enzyme [Pelosinus baikalensis]|uniref:Aminotransferase class I/II-fold pyridoxal phosphate-dependent enzyme n=1 Tax=Pelosinus baikalensis TaxID=2892015 RepID=A0ABS8HZ01_9FIRM|nr:aminotransferase class I/II-fold pyridoxal phosphate-dependent enzyme [Pelosinus baikalensis]MCC5468177.1 aminotransferase class I/II-fold pyridoxal phosphate-dependent enzyme [Pelosinus baikalensis]